MFPYLRRLSAPRVLGTPTRPAAWKGSRSPGLHTSRCVRRVRQLSAAGSRLMPQLHSDSCSSPVSAVAMPPAARRLPQHN